MNNLKKILLVLGCSIVFASGYSVGTNVMQEKIDDIRTELEEANKKQLKEALDAKDKTIATLMQTLNTSGAVQHELTIKLSRVQSNLDSANRKLQQDSTRTSEFRCRELLSEGGGLVSEGTRLLRDADRKLKAIKVINSP